MTNKKTIVRFDESMKPMIESLLETIGGDGHTIWKASILEHFPEGIQKRFIRIIESDGSYKGSIWNDGKMVDKLEGIYGLNLLGTICQDLGLKYESKLGRGFQARAYTDSIYNWLKA